MGVGFLGRPPVGDEDPAGAVLDTAEIERALADSDRQSSAAFDASPYGMLIADAEGRFLRVNAAFARLLDRPAGELLGHRYAEFTHPDDRETSDAQQRQISADPEATLTFDKRFVRPGGQVVWAHLGMTTIDGPGGQRYRLVQVEDVTARREAEAAAAREAARLRTAIQRQEYLHEERLAAEQVAAAAAARELQRLRDTLVVQRQVTAAAADREKTLQVVATRAVDLFPAADGAAVELLDGDDLEYVAVAGALTAFSGTRIARTGSLSGIALTSGTPEHCRDTGTDPRVNREACLRLGIGSMLIAPLHAQDRVIGVLKISSARTDVFDATDEQQLAMLAGSLSGALRHADDAARNAALLTERTRALAALEISETRFRLTFDNSPLGVTLISLDPESHGDYLAVNPAMTTITGYTAAELTAMTYHRLVHVDDARDAADHLSHVLATPAGSRSEYRYRHRDGHDVWVAVATAAVRDDTGRPLYLVNQVEDITGRRATEQARLAAERARDLAAAQLALRNAELEAANQLKLDIIGMLGHEISNPLSSICGYTEQLTEEWDELDDAERTGAVAAINRHAGRLDEIVGEVLAMVTIDAGAVLADRRELSVRDQIGHALTATRNDGLPVHGGDARVLFNPGHLQQILVNLLTNSAKYGGGATAIHVDTDGGTTRVLVVDEGAGVPEEFRDRLFERLSRADRDAASVKGTGLGLYIVRGLAQANHGDIRYEPNPAGGSVFVLSLQTAPAAMT